MTARKPAAITQIRPAGPNHQVITTQGGSGAAYRREPCPTCPWRVDATGEFPAEAFKHSAPTSYDAAFNSFACHASSAKKPATCAGFLLRNSAHNIAVRIAIIDDRIDMSQVSDGGHELHADYRAMAIANGVDPSDPVLAPCRG